MAAVTPPAAPLPGQGGGRGAGSCYLTGRGGGREGVASWEGAVQSAQLDREGGGRRGSVGQTLAGGVEGLVGVRGSWRE